MILHTPTDDDLRSKAREILGTDHTAADDPKLLKNFKAMHLLWRSQGTDNDKVIPSQAGSPIIPSQTSQAMWHIFEAQPANKCRGFHHRLLSRAGRDHHPTFILFELAWIRIVTSRLVFQW
jgi:hypothetical protein